jgi:hypothetical protein
MEQQAAGVHDGRARRRREPGRADLGDGVAGDEDVGGVSAMSAGVELRPPRMMWSPILAFMGTRLTTTAVASISQAISETRSSPGDQ